MASNNEDANVIELAAAQWVVRSQSETVREVEIVALTEWLEASDLHADAYRRALSLWYDLSPEGAGTGEPQVDGNVVSISAFRARKPQRPAYMPWAAGGAVAAALALIVCLPLVNNLPAAQVLTTGKGEHRTVALADGSQLMLNTDTRVSVRIGKSGARSMTLDHGEVALQVVHNPQRPFTLDTSDVRVTDLGTEFAVLNQSGQVRVAVRSGSLSVKPATGDAVTLLAGDTTVHGVGDTTTAVVSGDTQTAFAWQSGHAIYRDQPLSLVVQDLNRYFAKPIIVDDETGKLRLTAILSMDSESSVVGRLEEFLSLEAHETATGIVLSRPAGRRPS